MTLRRVFSFGVICAGVLLAVALPASAQYGPGGGVSVSPATVAPGGTVTVSGGCFLAGTEVQMTLQPGGASLGTATADADGNVSATVTIPAGTAAGQYTIEVSGTGCDNNPQVLSAAVTVSGTTAGGGSSGALPVTGSSNTGLLVGLGAVLVAGGALLALGARRARKQPSAA